MRHHARADRSARRCCPRADATLSWPNADDLIGSSTYYHTFPASGGSTSWTVTGTLPNWDGALDNFAEIYQGVHFAVKSNGVTSPYTNYQFSGVRSIHQ